MNRMLGSIKAMKKKMNRQTFLSYSLVFFVPYLALAIFLIANTMHNERKELQRDNQRLLTGVATKVEKYFEQLERISVDMSGNNAIIKPSDLPTLYRPDSEAALRRYSMMSGIVDNIYVHFFNQPQLYSVSGSLSVDAFVHFRYESEQLGETAFLQALHSKKAKLFRGTSLNSEHIFYFLPYFSNGKVIGRVIFSIPTSEFSRLVNLEKSLKEFELVFLVEEVPIFSTGENSDLWQKKTDFEAFKKRADYLSLEEMVYPSLHLKAMNFFPARLVTKKVLPTMIGLILTLVVFCLMGFVVVFVISYRQYQPIYRLNKLYMEIAHEENFDFDEQITRVGDYLFQTKLSLDTQRKISQNMEKSLFLEHLLTGYFVDEAEIAKEASALYESFLPNARYLAAVADTGLFASDEKNLKVNTVLASKFPYRNEHYTVEMVEFLNKRTMVFVFSFQNHLKETQLFRNYIKENFSKMLFEFTGITLELFYGNIENSLGTLNLSYLNALSKKDLSFRASEKAKSEELLEESSLEEECEMIFQAIKEGNLVATGRILREFIANVRAEVPDLGTRKQHYQAVFSRLQQVQRRVEDLFGPLDEMPAELEDLPVQIGWLAENLAQIYHQKNQEEREKAEKKILFIIEKRYCNPMFNLDELAEVFHVSLPKMSQMVKQETGITFSKYVQGLRMEKSKELLRNTNVPVKEVVAQIGYTDISNFTRKFREAFGMTPVEYRKVSQDE